MYQKLLKIDAVEAKKIEEETKGYAYAYQLLGYWYFEKNVNKNEENFNSKGLSLLIDLYE